MSKIVTTGNPDVFTLLPQVFSGTAGKGSGDSQNGQKSLTFLGINSAQQGQRFSLARLNDSPQHGQFGAEISISSAQNGHEKVLFAPAIFHLLHYIFSHTKSCISSLLYQFHTFGGIRRSQTVIQQAQLNLCHRRFFGTLFQ